MKGFKESRLTVLVLLAAALLFALAACGGSGGGGGGGGGKKALAKGGFIKTADLANNNSWYGHFNTAEIDRHVLHLYRADEIDGSGYITSIAFRSNTNLATNLTCPDITLKMGHTDKTALEATYANNYERGQGSLETVLTNSQVVIPPVSVGDYFEIDLKTPFYYNGVDNLVVDFIRTGACDDSILLTGDSTDVNSALYTSTLADAVGNLDFGLNMEFRFEGGVDQITQDGSSTGWFFPFSNGEPDAQKVQMLYMADEINGSGPITGLALKVGATTTNEIYTLDIKIGHTGLSNLVDTSTFANNFSGTPVTVASAAIWNVPAGVPAGDYVWLPFPDGVFKYNGTDNLLVEYNVTSASGDFIPGSLEGQSENRRIMGPADSAAALSGVGLNTVLYIAKFRFNGGTMDVLTNPNNIDNYPFEDATPNKRQYLYLASELGTKGKITKVAFRLDNDAVAGTYNSIQIVMGHSSLTELTDTYADNMTGAKTVFNGSYMIPDGPLEGDWIEIPLSSSFAYDGESNLVVQVAATPGTAQNNLQVEGNGTKYLNRHLTSADNTATTGLVNEFLLDQRLWIKK